jgi:hypothetical protein
MRATFRGAAALAVIGAIGGCGGATHHRSSSSDTTTGAAAPANDLVMLSGSPQQQISETAAAFYRDASTDHATAACALFSPAGRAGFMRAAKVSFPQSINQFSTCKEAMEIYYASLTASVQNLQQGDPTVSDSGLRNARIGDIHIHGDSATAIGPLNGLPVVNPKQLSFVRIGGIWRVNGSYSLSKSNLPQLLAKANKQHLKKVPKGPAAGG